LRRMQCSDILAPQLTYARLAPQRRALFFEAGSSLSPSRSGIFVSYNVT
jgi:hypothetical protein